MRASEIDRLLPTVIRRTLGGGDASRDPLAALLAVMEAMHAPAESALAGLDAFFDPHRAPPAFVPLLARWVDLRVPVTTGLGRLRELVASRVELSQWRGTARGLVRFLETATGMRGFQVDEQPPGKDGRPRPFHLRVRAPVAGVPHRRMLEQIIEEEKPAHVTYELVFADLASPSTP